MSAQATSAPRQIRSRICRLRGGCERGEFGRPIEVFWGGNVLEYAYADFAGGVDYFEVLSSVMSVWEVIESYYLDEKLAF